MKRKLNQIWVMQLELLRLFTIIADCQVGVLGAQKVVISALRNLPKNAVKHPDFVKSMDYLDSRVEEQINQLTSLMVEMGERLKKISENQEPPPGYG